jgi:PAS domain S-box-containing protein
MTNYQNKTKKELLNELQKLVQENNTLKALKGKRADELAIADVELAFQKDEKGKRAAELIIANKELDYQIDEKEKRADELAIADIELAFQKDEKGKRAAELVIANEELIYQNNEKDKRAKVEEALREANEYLENLINYANAPIIVWDTHFNITRLNKAFEFITGRAEKDVIGKSLEILFPHALRDSSMELIRGTFKGERWEVVEIDILHIDGTVRTLLWNSATIKSADGKTSVSTIAQGQDITERKIAETMLEKTMQNLERSNKELEQFAYVASHDLQEPLRMVSSYTQLLERRYKDKLDQDANDFIQYAVDGANRMQKLINDLLDYSRITSRGKDFAKVDISQILGQVISNLQYLIIENTALITNGDLPELKADESQILRVFQNLIENAIKFKKKSELPKIHISCIKKEGFYEFAVRDNGIGIDMQFHDRVFTIFQRLHSKEEYPGTGIGLSICRRIVERHGGKIWFESKENEGTTFYFTLKE